MTQLEGFITSLKLKAPAAEDVDVDADGILKNSVESPPVTQNLQKSILRLHMVVSQDVPNSPLPQPSFGSGGS